MSILMLIIRDKNINHTDGCVLNITRRLKGRKELFILFFFLFGPFFLQGFSRFLFRFFFNVLTF